MFGRLIIGLAAMMTVVTFPVCAQEEAADPLFGDVSGADLESDGQGVSKNIRPQQVRRVVIDNAAKKREALNRANATAAARKAQEAENAAAEQPEANPGDQRQTKDAEEEIEVPQSAIGIPSVMNGDAGKGEKPLKLLEKYRTERAVSKIKEAEKPLVSSDEMKKRLADEYNEEREKRRNMSRQESRQIQLERRQLQKERLEERRRIRKLPRAERHKLQQQLRDGEKARREKYLEDKQKRREMRKMNAK